MKRIVRHLPNDQYHESDAISHSGIVQALRSPEHFENYRNVGSTTTVAKEFGSAFHTFVLEPALFSRDYAAVDETLLTGTLGSLDEYKAAATQLGVKFEALNKDELKAAIKDAAANSQFTFKDDVQAEMAAYTAEKLAGSLSSLDELKQAAESLGIATAKMKKDDLKAAIQAADTESKFAFREDVQAACSLLLQQQLVGALSSLDDYKFAADELDVKYEALNKDELKVAIKAADTESKFKFREDEFNRLYGDKTILKQEQADALAAMRVSIFSHAGAAKMLSKGEAEASLFWTDERTGLQCRIRPDWMQLNHPSHPSFMDGEWHGMADLKSCVSASKEAFAKAVATYGYDVEAAFYIDGMKEVTGKTVDFYFIAVEKTVPYSTACYKASQEMIEVGRAKYRGALELLKWCQDNNTYPGYQPNGEVETIDLPRWAANYEMED